MRLAVGYVVGSDHLCRKGQAGRFDADLCQRPSAGSDDRPAVERKAGQEIEGAGKQDHSFQIFDLAAFHLAILSFVIGIRKIFANGGEAGTSVRTSDHFVGIESMLDRPAMPDAADGGRRVDKYAIEIEQERGTVELSHQVVILRGYQVLRMGCASVLKTTLLKSSVSGGA